MKPLPLVPELMDIAPRVIWFEEPQQALANPVRFLAYLMTYGTAEDIIAVRRHISDADFMNALDKAPPGIMDARSWAYWNVMAGRYPTPPMPRRTFPT
jgi:hypothetical protein